MIDLLRTQPDDSPEFDNIALYDDEAHAVVDFHGFPILAATVRIHPEEVEFLCDILNRERQFPGSVRGYIDALDAIEYGLEDE